MSSDATDETPEAEDYLAALAARVAPVHAAALDVLGRSVTDRMADRLAAIRAEAARRCPEDTETFGLWPQGDRWEFAVDMWLHDTGDTSGTEARHARWNLDLTVRFLHINAVTFVFSGVETITPEYADELIGQFYQEVSDSGFDPVRAMRLARMCPAVRETVMGVLRARNLP